jgi:hypothetical protein
MVDQLSQPPHPNEHLVGANVKARPLRLLHADLTRYGDSTFAVVCPACKEGLLVGRRHPESLLPRRLDSCLLCAQIVIYLDETIGGQAFHDPLPPAPASPGDPHV